MRLVSDLNYDSPVITVEKIKQSIIYKMIFAVGRDPSIADKYDWLRTVRSQLSQDSKQVYYLSMEFLIGTNPV